MSSYRPDIAFLDNTDSQKKPGIFIDPTADVHPNVYLEGEVVVGPYCRIDAGAVLTGVIHIGHHSAINCNVSLRGGITIGNYVHIMDQVNIEGGHPLHVRTSKTTYPARTILHDGCIIGPGSAMHDTQVGAGAVLGMRCNCDYNTYIGVGSILANGSATNVDQIVPDNCFCEGVPAVVIKENITDANRQETLGYVPSLWVQQMAVKLEVLLPCEEMTLANRKKNFDIDETAYISPAAILEGNIKIAPHVKIDAGSILIGDIEIGPYTYIALNVVIKGAVTVGDATHIYDNTLIDGARVPDVDVWLDESVAKIKIGSHCWINHGCSMRGTCVEDEGAVNIAAACDYGTRIAKGAIVGNGSATRINLHIPEDCFAEGVPAVIKNHGITDEDRQDYFGLIPRVWGDFAKNWMGRTDFPREPQRNLQIHGNAYVHPKVWLEGNITIGEYTTVNAGTCITGNVSFGKYCHVECNASLRGNMQIGNYTHIYDQVCIESGRPGEKAGSVTCEVGDQTVIGDYCWINHGCTMHGTSIEDGGAVNIGACCDYNTHIGKGAIVGNHSSTNINSIVQNNCLAVGIPSRIVKKFLKDEDRYFYFGVVPHIFVLTEDIGLEEMIHKKKKQE